MVRLTALWAAVVAAVILFLVIREEKLVARGKIPLGRLRRFWFQVERRRAPRYRVNWPARYYRPPDESDSESKTRDLSQTGACLVVSERLEIGAILRVELNLPEYPSPTTLPAQVMWLREVPVRVKQSSDLRSFFVGVRFQKLDPKLEAALKKQLENPGK